MKRGAYIFIIFLIFFFLILATALAFFFFELSRPPDVRAGSYLDVDLIGAIHDYALPNFFSQVFLEEEPLSVHDFWLNLKKAKADDRIRCVVLRLGYLLCDWGKINELREAVIDFRESGKKVYAYIEEAPDSDKEYFLATACDRLILHPLGWLGVNGIGGYVPFFKNTLAKLGIEAEFEQVEEFKTASNMFTEDRFTEPHRRMLEAIYDDIFSVYVKTVAEARKKSEEEVRKLIDHGLFQGENAVKAGLVDDILFEDELQNLIREKDKRLHKARFSDYSRVKPASVGLNRGRKIALIYGQGPILSGESISQSMGSRTISRWLRRAREDKSIAAIVFRVDSPGGSAVASDVISREVFLAKKTKPIVVSMSDVAGSGGYWVSMAAHKIIAHPLTLTGSIGVLAGKFNFSRLYEKLGVTAEKLIYGEKADIFSTFRKFTPQEKEILKKEILWVYDQFLSRAAEGRNMTKEEVDGLGKGRVWTGNQALKIKLVDEIGGLSVALETAKKLAGIPREEEINLVVWPKKVSFWRALFGGRRETDITSLSRNLDKYLSAFKLMERDRIWAVMPFSPVAE